MKYFSQKSYPNVKLGTCTDSISSSGCKIVSLGNFIGKDPVEINNILIKNNGYTSGCLVNDQKVAPLLGLQFIGKTTAAPDFECLMETNHFAPSVPQHFCLWRPDGWIVDPLDKNPTWKKNPYHIVSFRMFRFTTKPDSLEEYLEKPLPEITPNLPLGGGEKPSVVSSTNPAIETILATENATESSTTTYSIPIRVNNTPQRKYYLREVVQEIWRWIKIIFKSKV